MTRFICPGCERSAFIAISPLWSYEARRWRLWLPPRKRWVGDLVKCANQKCQVVSVAGLSGIFQLEVAQQEARHEAQDREVNPPLREVSQVFDSDMKWFRD